VRIHDKIFVYGTLKTGHGANSFLQNRAEFIGEDTIIGTLYNLGAFPGFKAVGTETVSGEIWEITDEKLPAMLDNYEGYPGLYSRVRVRTSKGYNVWVYVYNGRVREDALCEEGVW
jgi:gamma-glutamylcyclotransferase (GGCT)/AIG2-like uncharacterized protein YtfP